MGISLYKLNRVIEREIQIEQIRYEHTWQIRHEVMYPDLPLEAIKLQNDQDGIHFGLYVNGRLSSVISLFNEGNIYQFRKFATVNSEQGKGYGSLLLDYIISYVKSREAARLWCNARVSAMAFYHKFGFTATDRLFTQNGIRFIIMELALNTSGSLI